LRTRALSGARAAQLVIVASAALLGTGRDLAPSSAIPMARELGYLIGPRGTSEFLVPSSKNPGPIFFGVPQRQIFEPPGLPRPPDRTPGMASR